MSLPDVPRSTGAASPPDFGPTGSLAESGGGKRVRAARTKPTRTMPDRPIPTKGWPSLWYRVMLLLGMPHRVPRLSKAEVRSQIDEDLAAYRVALEDQIRETTQRRVLTATVTHVKGGAAKTTTSGHLASVLGETARRTVTVIDNNPMWGTTFRLLGVSREATMTVRQVRDRLRNGGLQTHREFVGALGSTRHNVSLIASDAVSQREDHYDYETAKLVISNAQHHSIFVVNDTGNDIGGNAMQAALELTDVMIVPTITTGDSLEGARVTLENYRAWGHEKLVRHSVIVVSGLEPGETAEQYRGRLGLDPEHILVGIPFELRLKDNLEINLADNDQATLIAYLELVHVVTSVARHVQDNGYDGQPMSFTQGELVPVPSGRTPVLPYLKTQEME